MSGVFGTVGTLGLAAMGRYEGEVEKASLGAVVH